MTTEIDFPPSAAPVSQRFASDAPLTLLPPRAAQINPICLRLEQLESSVGVAARLSIRRGQDVMGLGRSLALSPLALGLMTVAQRKGLLSVRTFCGGQGDPLELGKARLVQGLCRQGFMAQAGQRRVATGGWAAADVYEDFTLTACGALVLEYL